MNPKSPTRFTTKALVAAAQAARAFVPMADQQVGTQPDGFPEHEELQQVVGHDQHQHGKREQGDVAEETGIARLAVHVADRIDVHQRADTGDQHEHDGGQPVDMKTDVNVEMPGCQPGEQRTEMTEPDTATSKNAATDKTSDDTTAGPRQGGRGPLMRQPPILDEEGGQRKEVGDEGVQQSLENVKMANDEC